MELGLTEEQELYRRSLREFLGKVLEPRSRELFRTRRIPPELWRELAGFGLTGLLLPEEYGGSASDYPTFLVAVEELSRADRSGLVTVGVLLSNTEGLIVSEHGRERLKEELLPSIAGGRAVLGLASTEPGCGTDFTAVQTRIRREGEEYVVTGEKQCISLVAEAGTLGGGHLVTGKTSPELGHRGMGLIYVPLSQRGVEWSELETLGPSLGRIRYEGVRVPSHHLVGEENGGVYLIQEGFVITRVAVAMSLVGPTLRLLEEGAEYLKQRTSFGRPLARFQGVQFQLAEHRARVDAIRLLTYRAGQMVEELRRGRGNPSAVALAASEAKLLASVDCLKAVTDATLWYGAMGLTTELDAHFALRSVLGATIAEGTVEAQKIAIGSLLLGRGFSSVREA
jgi:alkylation response protein AidB-like acyl-CoA dehydrogenase